MLYDLQIMASYIQYPWKISEPSNVFQTSRQLRSSRFILKRLHLNAL